MRVESFEGRLLPLDQLPADQTYDSLAPVFEKKGQSYCFRCGSRIEENWKLPLGPSYCRACIVFGRVRTDQDLCACPSQPLEGGSYLLWQGSLTPYQSQVSEGLLAAWRKREESLVHAVTGAGKTEMIYPLLEQVLREGGRICLASPRMDVCRELQLRLCRDFSCPIDLLHAGSDPYSAAPLVIAITHQLLKFYQAFDLLIIDEVDAFPYVDNAMLYHAVENCLKPSGLRIYLTATSTENLDKRIAAGSLKRLSLPRRFHGNPLILPSFSYLAGLTSAVQKKKLPRKLIKDIKKQRQTGFPLLVFVPKIELGQAIKDLLVSLFPDEKIAFVSSKSEDRSQIVEAFRKEELTMLLTTTILERGVTFPKVDVMVLDAHHRLYSKSALIQIGGRVGRSMERATGLLLFYHEGLTRAMIEAKEEIALLNREAGFGKEED